MLDDPPADGGFDLLLHFHMFDAARRVLVNVAHPMVLAGFDLGIGTKAYAEVFRDGTALREVEAAIETELRAQFGPKAHIARLYLSSWSAGSGAIAVLLARRELTISGVVLLDSLYGTYARNDDGTVKTGTLVKPLLQNWLAFARAASKKESFLYMTYSEVPTTGYASTMEVASYFFDALHLRPTARPTDDPRGNFAAVDHGDFHARGYRGGDIRAHCNHLGYLSDGIKALRARQ